MTDMFVFKFNSPDKPSGSYKGTGWSEHVSDINKYKVLNSIKDWRKKLSNMFVSDFTLDGEKWNSVENYFHAVKYRGAYNKYYKTFTKNGGEPWSVEPFKAKQAGKAGRISKNGKIYTAKVDGVNIPKDVKMRDDFYEGVHWKSMKLGLLAKFTQNKQLKQLLLATKDAKLYHLVTRRGQQSKLELWDHLMQIRKCIRIHDNDINFATFSAMNKKQVGNYLN